MDNLDVVREILDCESVYISDSEKEERILQYLSDEITVGEALEGILEF